MAACINVAAAAPPATYQARGLACRQRLAFCPHAHCVCCYTQVAIDVDGGSTGRGELMAKHRILAHLGWRSATIRADDWRSLGGDAARQARFLEVVLGAALEGGSGANDVGGHGHVHGHSCGSGCSH